MGIVTDALISQIGDQVERNQVVVWFDPEKHYSEVVQLLSIPETQVFCYEPDQGFLVIRRTLEPLWEKDVRPRAIVYMPMSEEETHHALVEYTAVGAVLGPGHQPPDWNTRLAVVARRALSGICPEVSVAKIVAEIEAGKLSLAEVEQLAEGCAEIDVGALKLVFNTGHPEEILLRFLSDPSFDEGARAKGAERQLAQLISQALGSALTEAKDLVGLRKSVVRFVLLNDFIHALGDDTPEALASFPRPGGKAASQTLQRIAEAWRRRRDLAESYARAARQVAQELNLSSMTWPFGALERTHTFLETEQALQAAVELAMYRGGKPNLDPIARDRSQGYWASQDPLTKLRWVLIGHASEVLLLADRIETEVKKKSHTAGELIAAYAQGENPWCSLDSAYRHLERDFHHFDLDQEEHEYLVKLVAAARQRYAAVTDMLATRFVRALETVQFNVPGAVHQTEVFRGQVAPALEEGKTAYLLVDALRYEMAHELLQLLGEDWRAQLAPALAAVPTVTEVGMAALMPGAERGMAIESGGGGKLASVVGGVRLSTRQDRLQHLSASISVEVVAAELTRIAPLTDTKLRKKLEQARLIVVTAADEIDGLWENTPEIARRLHDDVFTQLRRGVRTLFSLQVEKIIIAADHGHLFGEKLAAGDLMEPPGGQVADLNRRVWVGRGGTTIEGCLRAPLSVFGLGGDLELVTPYGLACFKAPGGSMEYFHGGLSPQELIVPVMVVEPIGPPEALGREPAFTWRLTLGSERVTTRFFSVTIAGEAQKLFEEPPRLRPELREGGRPISVPVASTYGFQESTRDVMLAFEGEGTKAIRPNTVTLQITDIPKSRSVTMVLIDSETGLSLEQVSGIPVEISI